MIVQRQKKDELTKFEIMVYSCFCYGATACALLSIFLVSYAQTSTWITIFIIAEFFFLGVGAVFGFGIKHDARVLDLRHFKK